MQAVWAGWLVTASITLPIALLIIAAVLCSPHARKAPINVYLVAISLTDVAANTATIIISLLGIAQGGYPGVILCNLQCWLLTMHLCNSMWINTLIAFEVFKILSATKKLSIYTQQSRRSTVLICLALSAFSSFNASATLIDAFPVEPVVVRGVVCFPAPTDGKFTSSFVGFVPAVVAPAIITGGVILMAQYRGLINWHVLRLHWLSRGTHGTSDREASARSHRLSEALEEERYLRAVRQARQVTLFFLRVGYTLGLWLPVAFLANFANDLGLIFLCLFIGLPRTLHPETRAIHFSHKSHLARSSHRLLCF